MDTRNITNIKEEITHKNNNNIITNHISTYIINTIVNKDPLGPNSSDKNPLRKGHETYWGDLLARNELYHYHYCYSEGFAAAAGPFLEHRS